jgi:hypothetical protein
MNASDRLPFLKASRVGLRAIQDLEFAEGIVRKKSPEPPGCVSSVS